MSGVRGVFQVPTWPLKLIIIVGCVATALQFLLLAWQSLRVTLGIAPAPALEHKAPE